VEELFEARRMPKGEAVITRISGVANIIQSDRISEQRTVRVDHSEIVSDEYDVPEEWTITVHDEETVSLGDSIAQLGEATIAAQHVGKVRVEGRKVIVSYENRETEEYEIPTTSRLLIRDGEQVIAGQALTEGSLNPHTVLRINGRDAVEMYLMTEIQKVYRAQGQNINDKHFEVLIRKMVGKVQIMRSGDTPYLPMDLVDRLEIRRVNDQLLAEGKQPAKYAEILLGVTKASLSTDSFLSASSFQHTIKVLAGAAIASTEDPLFGLKENVIIGKLIPAGTGFVHGRFDESNGVDTDAEITPASADELSLPELTTGAD
jgi:DNA-directed RNA polymerase subunit beta'